MTGRSTFVGLVCLAFVLIFAATASASQPTISYTIDGISGTNGWYRGSTHGNNVILHWSVSLNATSTNCLAAVTIPGPTGGTTQSCWAQNADGRTTAVTRVIKIDATPPNRLKANFSRKADYHGWYNHPVTIHWSGCRRDVGDCPLLFRDVQRSGQRRGDGHRRLHRQGRQQRRRDAVPRLRRDATRGARRHGEKHRHRRLRELGVVEPVGPHRRPTADPRPQGPDDGIRRRRRHQHLRRRDDPARH